MLFRSIDVTHLPAHRTTARFPHIYRFCLDHGLDITRRPAPVAPAAHYMMGGVKVNTWGETSIAGLFATGEVACTGVHGANRLASNSMLEVVVFSKRIIERTGGGGGEAAPSQREGVYHRLSHRNGRAATSPPALADLQSLLWEDVGIIRHRETLTAAIDTLGSWQTILPPPSERASYELANLVTSARLMAEAALLREESRGAHFRADFPETTAAWQRHIVFTR